MRRSRPGRAAPRAALPAPAIAATPAHGPALRLIRRSAEQANILVGARAPSYNDPDRYVADILNVILGEGMSSRLFLELRERRALVYDVHSFLSRLSDSGVLGIGLACEPRRAATALEAAIAELRRLAEEPVGDAELTKAREYTKGRLLLGLESTSAICEYAGQQLLLQGHILEPDEVVARLEAVDAAQVSAACRASARLGFASRGGRAVSQRDAVREGDRVMRACQTCAP